MVPAFYSTLIGSDEDNTSLRTIVGSFELQVLPSDIAEITNTPNDNILCRGGENWWEELSATEEDVVETLIGKRNMRVHSHLSFTYSF